MKKIKSVFAEDLLALGFPEGKIIGIALRTINQHFSSSKKQNVESILKKVLDNPGKYLSDKKLQPIADELIQMQLRNKPSEIELKEKGDPYKVYGQEHIEQGAIDQMEIAMQLPVTVAGALMPDAHQGYGLPIGGVLATRNAIIPYGVGVDIGCRMALSIYDIPESHLFQHKDKFKRELIAWTKFGAGQNWSGNMRADHEILDNPDFNAIHFIRNLKDKAAVQLGTSGGGNHFVEYGIIEFEEDDAKLNIKKGRYVALLTHSGSRGLGATIAGHYTRIAKEICKLPKEAANLAYLDLDTAEGQEYWLAMNLAGDYASACHEVIHDRLSKAIGGNILAKIENHHNFAWKEIWNGEEVIVHRKGATPAGKDVMGIIPGSMTAPGFLVRGKGEQDAIQSASHGAGRQMSRTQAIKSITRDSMRDLLKSHEVTLIGAGLDEAPMAYKDIEMVMASQKDLVDVVAKFTPKLVRMADDGSRED